jgi:hypothetical protein
MTIELLKALFTILKHCMECNNCGECSMREFCGK